MTTFEENNDFIVKHSAYLLNSFVRLVGYELLPRSGNAQEEARRLFYAPFVVVSHGMQADPVLNYGNETALNLWAAEWAQFTAMPSRLTAEAVHHAERERLLTESRLRGFCDNYQGIRIATTGKRFRILQAIVWMVENERGEVVGQAATFARWEWLE